MARTDVFVCELCPKLCRITEGHSGDCKARIVLDGQLRAVTYGRPCALHIDPVEKKPLFHFLPGTRILSVATAGCNLHCKFCQNWAISQAAPEDLRSTDLSPKKLVELAVAQNCPSVAYTYTEPVTFFEYTLETSKLARERRIKNVTVTAGYINRRPMEMLCRVVDASNTDLKAFNDAFYKDLCDGSLKPVLDGMVLMRERGVWLEVTNLIVPTFNDDIEMIRKMCRWMLANLGADTPLHLSRFVPMYKMRNLPPTPVDFLLKARAEALEIGLRYVYVGNVLGTGAENTYCPSDGALLIQRIGYQIAQNYLANGKCPKCGQKIAGMWENDNRTN